MKYLNRLIAVTLFFLAAFSCRPAENEFNRKNLDGKVRLTVSVGDQTKAQTQTSDEKKINSFDLWVFDSEGVVQYQGRVSEDTQYSVTVDPGELTFCALVNAPASAVTGFSTVAEIDAYHMALADQGRDALFMKGKKVEVIASDGPVSVSVTRDVARFSMSAAPVFSGAMEGASFEGAYLVNVPKNWGASTVLTASSEADAWNFHRTAETSPQQTALLSVPKTAPTTAVYGLPNASAERASVEVTDYVTRLAVKASKDGNTYWYPISIPNVQSNKVYKISGVNISLPGSEHIDEPLLPESLDVSVEVLDWNTGVFRGSYTDGSVFRTYVPLTFEALTDGTITWTASDASVAGKVIEYSRNGGATWTELVSAVSPGASIDVTAGEKLLFRGNNYTYGTSSSFNKFGGTAQCIVYGYLSDLLPESNKDALSETVALAYLFAGYSNLRMSDSKMLVLPAMKLSRYCYYGMFSGCTGLTVAPELPATALAERCYASMFRGCTSLSSAPFLPAMTLAKFCYTGMFDGCSALTTVPVLPATNLAENCYEQMFQNCASLAIAPALPATTLAKRCYTQMFFNCQSLVSAPNLPAMTLGEACYMYMFSKCNSLKQAPDLPAKIMSIQCYAGMFYNCSNLVEGPDIQAETMALSCFYEMFYNCIKLETAPDLPATTLADACYKYMFRNCSGLTAAPELPATTLAMSCYSNMFYECTNLSSAPELPAMVLESECYQGMFYGCTKLSTAPELPATSLANSCYQNMFQNCRNLISAPELPATGLAKYCYSGMFRGCWGLTAAPELKALELADYCYGSMFYQCTGLSIAPELPATALAKYCYSSMFYGCSRLTVAPNLPATTLADYCYSEMFSSCSSLTTPPSLPASTLTKGCYSNMFSYCTSLTSAPELQATELAQSCYAYMFSGCHNLSYVKAMFTTEPSSTYTSSWLSNVKSTGTFVKNAAATWDVTGTSGIPAGWTVETATE